MMMSKMKIAVSTIKIECSKNPRKYDVDFEFMLFVSDDARDLFRYYNKTEFHGLNVHDCEKRIQSGGTYIDGLVNYHPNDVDCQLAGRPFMFLNLKTMNEQPIWKTAAMISHESCHMSIIIETNFGNPDDSDGEREERVISGMEQIANAVMERLNFPKIFFQIG